jgi:hypothetical protein
MSTIRKVRVLVQAALMLPALALLIAQGGPQSRDFDEAASW